MPGGADGMSVLYPGGDPLYAKLRPNLALSGGQCSARTRASSGTPRWRALAQLHAEGKVTALPAIGYDHPDQSHFTSRHYWEVGATDTELRTGWMGRYLDEVGTADNPLQGLSLTGQLEPTLATAVSRWPRSPGRTSTPSAPRASGAGRRSDAGGRSAASASCTRPTRRC